MSAIVIAATNAQWDAVREALNQEVTDNDKANVLVQASNANEWSLVKALIEQDTFTSYLNTLPSGTSPDLSSLALSAAEAGQWGIVKTLVSRCKFNVDAIFKFAAQLRLFDVLECMFSQTPLDAPQNADKKRSLLCANISELLLYAEVHELLLFAVHHRCSKLIEYLCDKGVSWQVDLWKWKVVLFSVVERGDLDVIKTLLEKGGFNLKQRTDQGYTLLCIALRNGRRNIVEYLIEIGVDPSVTQKKENSKDANGQPNINASISSYALGKGTRDIREFVIANPLEVASLFGLLDFVKYLVSKGFDIKGSDGQGRTLLYIASQYGHLKVVEYLVEKGADVNQKANNDNSPLYIASQHGHLKVVKYLVKKGANVNQGNSLDLTALCAASCIGSLEVVKYLVEKGADVNQADKNGNAALFFASTAGHLKVVKHLVKKGADVKQKANGIDPLYIASQHGQLDIVQYLIRKGADMKQTNDHDKTLLSNAFWYGRLDIVKYLFKKGVVTLENGIDGLLLSCKDKQLNQKLANDVLVIVKYLVKKGVDVTLESTCVLSDAENAFLNNRFNEVRTYVTIMHKNMAVELIGSTSSLHVASKNGPLEFVKYLVKKGANVNQKDNNGDTALHAASHSGFLEVVKYLVKMGANVNQADNNGDTALHAASHSGFLEVVKYLVKMGANVNQADNNGNPALHTALRNDHLNIVQHFIENRENVNQADKNGHTALHTASYIGSLRVVEYLVENRANVNQADNRGNTALFFASKASKLGIMNYLRSQGAK